MNKDQIVSGAKKQVTIDSWNASLIPQQIMFGSHNFEKPQIELHPSEKTTEWVTKCPGCSSYVTCRWGRGELWVSMFQTMSGSSPHTAEADENKNHYPPRPHFPQSSPCLSWHTVHVGLDATAGGVIRMLGKWAGGRWRCSSRGRGPEERNDNTETI